MRLSYAELQGKVHPCGKIGKYLFDEMQEYGNSEKTGWTLSEGWSLGDSPCVGLAIDFCIGDGRRFFHKYYLFSHPKGTI